MPARRGDVDRPMAGAADIGGAPGLKRLVGADLLAALVVMPPFGRADQLAKLVIEPFVPEIALFLGDPFLKPEMRLDDEFGHRASSGASQHLAAGTLP